LRPAQAACVPEHGPGCRLNFPFNFKAYGKKEYNHKPIGNQIPDGVNMRKKLSQPWLIKNLSQCSENGELLMEIAEMAAKASRMPAAISCCLEIFCTNFRI
jgi:hypothetical protein